MPDPFIFINTCALRPGKADQYRQLCDQVAELVDANEPEMLYFACGISDGGARASTVQIHADVSNMSRHMEVVGPVIGQAMEECLDPTEMTIDIYGAAPGPLVDQLRDTAGTDVAINVYELGSYVTQVSADELHG